MLRRFGRLLERRSGSGSGNPSEARISDLAKALDADEPPIPRRIILEGIQRGMPQRHGRNNDRGKDRPSLPPRPSPAHSAPNKGVSKNWTGGAEAMSLQCYQGGAAWAPSGQVPRVRVRG